MIYYYKFYFAVGYKLSALIFEICVYLKICFIPCSILKKSNQYLIALLLGYRVYKGL